MYCTCVGTAERKAIFTELALFGIIIISFFIILAANYIFEVKERGPWYLIVSACIMFHDELLLQYGDSYNPPKKIECRCR